MQVDWITVVAQIVNFAVLVALLKHFLYGPIVRAMTEREQGIARRVDASEQERAKAEQASIELRDTQRQLEESRIELLNQARKEADHLQAQLVEAGRQEVAETRGRWLAELEREKESFFVRLRQEVGRELGELSRRVLRDLANVELEEAMVDVFLARLADLDEEAMSSLEKLATSAEHSAVVYTAFDPSEATKDRIGDAVRQQFGMSIAVRVERSTEMICGIALHINGRRLAWSVDQYLAEVEESVANLLVQPTPHARPTRESLRPC